MSPAAPVFYLRRIRKAIRLGLFALLMLAPLPFGSVQGGAILILQLSAMVLGGLACLVLCREPVHLPGKVRWLFVPVAILVSVGFAQTVPVPSDWAGILAARSLEARSLVATVVPDVAVSALPVSFSAPDTLDATLLLAAYVLAGLAAFVALRDPAHFVQAAMVLCVCGAFQAIYGSAEYLSGHQQIFGYVKKHYVESATGTFINRNHFAGYLALVLPFAYFVLFRPSRHRHRGAGWRERFILLFQDRNYVTLFAWICVVAIWAGVILSYSRGGLAAAFLATILAAFRTFATRQRAWVLATTLAIPLLFLSWQEVKAPGERFLADREELATLNLRLPTWRATLEATAGFLPLGAGYGTFESAIVATKPLEVEKRLSHAHNDWLEWFLEGGLPVATTAGLFLYLVSRTRRPRGFPRATVVSIYSCALFSIVVISFHSAIDFPLRIPAVALTTAVVAGALLANRIYDGNPELAPETESGHR